jgi:hypothetical protein
VAREHRVEDAGDGSRRAGAFLDRFGKVPGFQEIREAAKEVAGLDRGAVEIQEPLHEDA